VTSGELLSFSLEALRIGYDPVKDHEIQHRGANRFGRGANRNKGFGLTNCTLISWLIALLAQGRTFARKRATRGTGFLSEAMQHVDEAAWHLPIEDELPPSLASTKPTGSKTERCWGMDALDMAKRTAMSSAEGAHHRNRTG